MVFEQQAAQSAPSTTQSAAAQNSAATMALPGGPVDVKTYSDVWLIPFATLCP